MILIGPLLMFGGLLMAAWLGDRYPYAARTLGTPDERDLADLQALEDQAQEEWAREDREREQGSDSWALDRLGHLLEQAANR